MYCTSLETILEIGTWIAVFMFLCFYGLYLIKLRGGILDKGFGYWEGKGAEGGGVRVRG